MIPEKPKSDVRVGMSLEDYMREANDNPFEIINGERVYKMPPMTLHTRILKAVLFALESYVIHHRLGESFPEMTYILPEKYDSNWVTGSRVPDIVFYTRQRLEDYFNHSPDWDTRPMLIVPDLTIEIISPNESFSQIDVKVTHDLANGVKAVWLIDPTRRKAWVYTPEGDSPVVFGAEGILTKETLLPNFKLELAKTWV